MVEHIWTVLCSHAVVDKDTNNVSLHNVIEQVNVKGTIPAQIGRASCRERV
jgi:hypothetical protein